MSIFLPLARVRKLPQVLKVYKNEKVFKAAVLAEANGSHVWARWAPGITANSGDSNLQADVTAIPGVPALTSTGALA